MSVPISQGDFEEATVSRSRTIRRRRVVAATAAFVLSWICLLCVGGLFQPNEVVWGTLLGLHALGVIVLLAVAGGWMGGVLISGLLTRLIILWLDLYTSIPVFSSGADTEMYYQTALAIYAQPDLLGTDTYGGAFARICGALYLLIGPSRLFVQYMNVTFGLIALVFIGRALIEAKVSVRRSRITLLFCALMPIPAIMSALYLRESVIICLVAVSAFFFLRWVTGGRAASIMAALGMIAFASVFHVGALGVAVGYMVGVLFYDRVKAQFSFSASNLLRGLTVLAVGGFIIARFPSLFLEKLENLSSADDAISLATAGSSAGSAYLSGVSIDDPTSFLLFAGLKAIYLFVSPLPMDWRGIGDIAAFAVDGLLYLVAIVIVFRGVFSSKLRLLMAPLRILLVGILAAGLVLGAGTSSAGTAMRHRQKVMPVVAVAVAIALNARGNETNLTTVPKSR